MKIRTILAIKGMKVITVRPDQPLHEAVRLLAQHNIGALVVEKDGHPVGVISERDIVRALAQRTDALARPIADVMTTKVVVGSPSDDLKAVLKTMTERRFRHLPVMEHGHLMGIVSIGDLVKAQIDEYEGAIETLHDQLSEG